MTDRKGRPMRTLMLFLSAWLLTASPAAAHENAAEHGAMARDSLLCALSHRLLGVRRIHGLLQSTLELAPVDQTCQRIMRRLVTHLPGQATNFADIVEYNHRARYRIAGSLDR